MCIILTMYAMLYSSCMWRSSQPQAGGDPHSDLMWGWAAHGPHLWEPRGWRHGGTRRRFLGTRGCSHVSRTPRRTNWTQLSCQWLRSEEGKTVQLPSVGLTDSNLPDRKVHGAKMGAIWGLQDHGSMNDAILAMIIIRMKSTKYNLSSWNPKSQIKYIFKANIQYSCWDDLIE